MICRYYSVMAFHNDFNCRPVYHSTRCVYFYCHRMGTTDMATQTLRMRWAHIKQNYYRKLLLVCHAVHEWSGERYLSVARQAAIANSRFAANRKMITQNRMHKISPPILIHNGYSSSALASFIVHQKS